jgi:hypothetical protein
MAQGDREVGLADAGWTDEQDVGLLLDEAQRGEV